MQGSGSGGVSFVIATYNRRDVLLHCLEQIQQVGPEAGRFEIIVVDNASTDGTARAVAERFEQVVLLPQAENRGPCAKNAALAAARGEFVVFLDDDSFPQPGSVRRMLEHFARDPGLGAAVFTVNLPDGSRECSAYPDVCIGCGTGLRRAALVEAGGLPEEFFMGAEEYDLSLRLLDAGWRIRGFGDLHVTHLKTPQARFPRRITRLDARNNLLLALRYFPEPWRMIYATEWMERYRLMAAVRGHSGAFWIGALQGLVRGLAEDHRPISDSAFEQFAKIEQINARMAELKRELGLRRVLLVDLGKNIPAFRLAAARCGLNVAGVADARLGGRGWSYRGWPILSDAAALGLAFDAAIISNLSVVHARQRFAGWRELCSRPVIDLLAQPATAEGNCRQAA